MKSRIQIFQKEQYQIKRYIALLLTAVMLISQPASTLATNKGLDTNIIEVVSSSDLTQGEKVEIKTVDKFNNEVIIGIEEVVEPKGVISECNTKNASTADTKAATATYKTHKVYYISGVLNASYYVKVQNNKIVSAYDKSVSAIGGTCNDIKLEYYPSYAKLSFNLVLLNLIGSTYCWLKATPTGSDNNISVTYN